MNRDILFRGKRINNGQWIYGSLISDDVIVGSIVGFEEDFPITDFWHIVVPETVGQFTGLYDSTKREEATEYQKDGYTKETWKPIPIFDGDIVRHKFKRIWATQQHISRVVWSDKFMCYYLFDGMSYHRMRDDIQYHVIGNIFDNKELLDATL